MEQAKPFSISKREVWEASKRVKANQGAAGVDGQSIAEFERDLSNNLYKLWNRLASGRYSPPRSTGRHTKGRGPDKAARDSDMAFILHLYSTVFRIVVADQLR